MTMRRVRSGFHIAVVAALAGCGATEPYVYKKEEFNRNAKTFNKEPEDRGEVTICYNGVGTSDKRVANMAEEECAKYGKTARRDHETCLSAFDGDRTTVRLHRGGRTVACCGCGGC